MTVLRKCEPGLDIFTGRTGIVAGWEEIDVIGAARTQRARTSVVARQIRALCQVFGIHD